MNSKKITIEPGVEFDLKRVLHNPDDEFYATYLKPYYALTRDGQYLFASQQLGRAPSRAFHMQPDGYRLGKAQRLFEPGVEIGRRFYDVILRYLAGCKTIVLEGIQGEAGYATGVRLVVSIQNPHSAYMAWMGKQMIFPYQDETPIRCWNYIVPEPLPAKVIEEIHTFFPGYDPTQPITLYDWTQVKADVRRVLSVGFDYFGGAFKKPNLTLVWNRGEAEGFVSYHAGCTSDRILKGLSGTGKTTLSVGPELEQDDACLGRPFFGPDGKIEKVQIIGLEAASFAKSEGLTPASPEWPGLMKSAQVAPDGHRAVVLAMNIDCEGVEYRTEKIAGYTVKVPRPIAGQKVGSLQCTHYEKSRTTNGRFIFLFSELNPGWGSGRPKWLASEGLSFKRSDVMEPAFRVTDPLMAVALDAGCESIITSALADQKVGMRVRTYAATDFMAREQAQQALIKLKMYRDLGLDDGGKLVFFITNAGYVGEYDLAGNRRLKRDAAGQPVPKIDPASGQPELDEAGAPRYIGAGEKISVADSKRLLDLIEHRKIRRWLTHPVYGYRVPDPRELEEEHGMVGFRRRFNPLRFYTPEEILAFARRDIAERTAFLRDLFAGQAGEAELQPVIEVWERIILPDAETVRRFYEEYYGIG